MLSSKFVCPNCTTDIILEKDEQIQQKFQCPNCDCFIDCIVEPPKIFDPTKYSKFFVTINQSDISFIKSVFDGHKIDYFILGENFLTMDPLIQGAQIYILSSDFEKAKELLQDFKPNIFGVSTSK